MRATIACTPARGTARGALVGIHADLVAAVLIEGPERPAIAIVLDATARGLMRSGVHLPEVVDG